MNVKKALAACTLLCAPLFAGASEWVYATVDEVRYVANNKIYVDISDTAENLPNCVSGRFDYVVTEPLQIRLIVGAGGEQGLYFKGNGNCDGNNEELQHVKFDDSDA